MTTRRLTVRARLTALYGGVFLLAGTALLAITYVLLAQALNTDSFSRQAILAVPAVPAATIRSADPAGLDTDPQDDAVALEAEVQERMKLAEQLQMQFRRQTLTSLLQRGAVALAGVAVVGIWLGWLMAGRTLRPLQQITATARRVADRNLHERIGLTGPKDELRQLAARARVIGRVPARHRDVPDDRCPGVLVQVGAGFPVAVDPFVAPGRVVLTEVAGDHPPSALVGVSAA